MNELQHDDQTPEAVAAAAPPVVIPYQQLDPDTLHAVLVDFATRDGTDYGEVEVPLERKVQQLHAQLVTGEVAITFDRASDTCTLVPRRSLG